MNPLLLSKIKDMKNIFLIILLLLGLMFTINDIFNKKQKTNPNTNRYVVELKTNSHMTIHYLTRDSIKSVISIHYSLKEKTNINLDSILKLNNNLKYNELLLLKYRLEEWGYEIKSIQINKK